MCEAVFAHAFKQCSELTSGRPHGEKCPQQTQGMCLESLWDCGHGLISLRFLSLSFILCFILFLSPSPSLHLSLYLSYPHFISFFILEGTFPATDLDLELALNTHTHTEIERKMEREKERQRYTKFMFFIPHSAEKPKGSPCTRHEDLHKNKRSKSSKEEGKRKSGG